jgi:hypothetical protein
VEEIRYGARSVWGSSQNFIGDVSICQYRNKAQRGLLTASGGVRRVYGEMRAGLDRWDRLAQHQVEAAGAGRDL